MLRRIACLLVLALALGPTAAWAERDDPDGLIGQGLKAMRKGDYQAALDAFRRAHRARPTPRSHTEIGLAEQALHLWVEAEADLASALAEPGDAWLQEHRPLIEKALADIRSHLGLLSIESGPPGAEVEIDGKPRGLLPLTAPIFLRPGPATVEITAPERQPWRRQVDIVSGETTRVAPIFEPIDLPVTPAPAAPVAVSQAVQPPPPEPRTARAMGWLALVAGGAAAASGGYLLSVSIAGSSRRLAAIECLALGSTVALSGGLILTLTAWRSSDAAQAPSRATGLSVAGRF